MPAGYVLAFFANQALRGRIMRIMPTLAGQHITASDITVYYVNSFRAFSGRLRLPQRACEAILEDLARKALDEALNLGSQIN